MARTIKDPRLTSRTVRTALASRREPYWVRIEKGCYIGYRRTATTGTWVGRWRGPDGKQRYQALGASDDVLDADGLIALSFDQAQATARSWFHAIAARVVRGHGPGPYTLADCLRDYLAWARLHRKSAPYMEKNAARFILPLLGACGIAALTAPTIAGWLERLVTAPPPPAARATGRQPKPRAERADPDDALRCRKLRANRQLTLLKAALNWAWGQERLLDDRRPWMKVKKFEGVERSRTDFLTLEEASRLIDTCTEEFRPLVGLALLTGARYGELCRLRIEDFRANSQSLFVGASKSGKSRHIPLNDQAATLCRRLVADRPATAPLLIKGNGSPWRPGEQTRRMKSAVVVAGLKSSFSFHGLRHTWTSLALMNGAPLMVAARVLGHGDTSMIEDHYGHLHGGFLRNEVTRTAPSFSIQP